MLSSLTGILSLLVCIAILFSFFDKYWWIFELTSHFRIQYAWISLPLIILLFAFKRNAYAATLAILATANAIALSPHITFASKTSTGETAHTTAALINVNTHLGSPKRIQAYVESVDPDILILLEINKQWVAELPEFKSAFPHRAIQTREDNFGIGLYSKYPFISINISSLGESSVPYINAALKVGASRLNVISQLGLASYHFSQFR